MNLSWNKMRRRRESSWRRQLSETSLSLLGLDKNASGIDHHIRFIRTFSDFTGDRDRTEFLHPSQPLETDFQRLSRFVHDLHRENGSLDHIGIIAADIPRCLAFVTGTEITSGDLLRISHDHDGATVHEDSVTSQDMSGEGHGVSGFP
jgi:hypothetical protein